MILEYHRPQTLAEALKLLKRAEPLTAPLGGGTTLNQPATQNVAVVDLQALGLEQVDHVGNQLQIGARLTLQTLLGLADLPSALHTALRHEASYNLRQAATLAGSLLTADGRSPLATVLLALDASVKLVRQGEKPQSMRVGELLLRRELQGNLAHGLKGALITSVELPAQTPGLKVAYEAVGRTPADRPLVCAAAAAWDSGRVRITLGGTGRDPVLVLDGPEPAPRTADLAEHVRAAAQAAFSQAGDEWASAAYRQQVAGTLAVRCITSIRE